ncbi:MAG TPA: MFS transporter [Coxiellaceae bacterium]|nr:MAG: hypothetical protein A3E81_07520 [Gammaproteobacteria bacterium RIFCSPHIGHO2_12_FULL_36_30]HLB56563.1 MFS transporter [Coxiellaceae bacterium]
MNIQIKIPRRVFIGTLSGVFLEYFDYTLYGFSAPIIAKLFFPHENPMTELLLAWAVFAISFLVRPIGAIIFGHFADRIGRRIVLMITIFLMSVATLSIGLLPTYEKIGILSPILLILFRILQGLSVSTEYSGCSTYLLEFNRHRKGLLSGIITSASGFGVFAASFLVLLFHNINWRFPFIIAAVLVGLLGFYFRLGLQESPEFLKAAKEKRQVHFPFLILIRKFPRLLFKAIIISAFAGVSIIVIEIYLPSYLHSHFLIAKEKTLEISTYLAWTEACFAIIWGAISDYISQRKTIMISGMLMLIGIFPILKLFHSQEIFFWYGAATLLAIIVAAVDGPIAALLVDTFSTEIRYSGVSISYNVGAALIGGFSPSILILLQEHTVLHQPMGWYLVGISILLLFAIRN